MYYKPTVFISLRIYLDVGMRDILSTLHTFRCHRWINNSNDCIINSYAISDNVVNLILMLNKKHYPVIFFKTNFKDCNLFGSRKEYTHGGCGLSRHSLGYKSELTECDQTVDRNG